MSNRIYKYSLEWTSFQSKELPVGAKILTLQIQGHTPTIWAEVNENEKHREIRHFARIPTGYDEVPRGANYITTVQDGLMVWHWYECKEQ